MGQDGFEFVKWIPAKVERELQAAQPRATIGKGRTITLNNAAVALLMGWQTEAVEGVDHAPILVALYYDERQGAVAIGETRDAAPLLLQRRKGSSRTWAVNAAAFNRDNGIGGYDKPVNFPVFLVGDLVAFRLDGAVPSLDPQDAPRVEDDIPF